jgi:diguanylate cyclase (GGDEF)-like protein
LIVIFNRSAYKNDEKLTKMAYIDSLTGIPNHAYLMDELKEWCSKGSYDRNALLLINISNFKALNMAFGYDFGDSVLKRVAEQLYDAFDKKYDIFRFASDRFVLLVKSYKDRNDLNLLAEQIVNSVDKEIIAHGYTKALNLNIGIVEVGGRYRDPNDIIRDATIALDYVGVVESELYSYYEYSMMEGLKRDEEIEAELIKAILNPSEGGLHLVYQPIFDARTNKISGFEALARLNSPVLGPISPIEFIAIAERRRLMVQLGNWIVDTALLFLKDIENQGVSGVKISINISAAQLQDKSFIPRLRRVMAETRIKPSNVELEVTESIILDNYEEINSSLGQLRKEGVTIAVDDFGTGYSSFSRLNQLNIDTIKIDKTFIERITNTPHEMLLTGDIISLCHRLDLTVVAEGVENDVQAAYLLDHNCDKFQGYLFSKPLQFREAIYILRDQIIRDA